MNEEKVKVGTAALADQGEVTDEGTEHVMLSVYPIYKAYQE